MRSIAKRFASVLPRSAREAVQRTWYTYRIKTGDFKHDEPEFARLREWIAPGDLVLDIGANLGIYTAEMSRIVGPQGRVFAFEPVPETFRFLVHNSRHFPHNNITFLNVAVSSKSCAMTVNVPTTSTGIPASARASVQANGTGPTVTCLPLDQIQFWKRVSFVKIDVEGHESEVLAGMSSIIKTDRPTWVIEGTDPGIHQMMTGNGYRLELIPNSPNSIFHP
jgi:FkbM family methyltransferase